VTVLSGNARKSADDAAFRQLMTDPCPYTFVQIQKMHWDEGQMEKCMEKGPGKVRR